jgi:hypothetical protein
VIDDFRSATESRDSSNFAINLATLDWRGNWREIDADFSSRVDHRHDSHDQFEQVRGNVKVAGFDFCAASKTRIICLLSVDIRCCYGGMESNGAAQTTFTRFQQSWAISPCGAKVA